MLRGGSAAVSPSPYPLRVEGDSGSSHITRAARTSASASVISTAYFLYQDQPHPHIQAFQYRPDPSDLRCQTASEGGPCTHRSDVQ